MIIYYFLYITIVIVIIILFITFLKSNITCLIYYTSSKFYSCMANKVSKNQIILIFVRFEHF